MIADPLLALLLLYSYSWGWHGAKVRSYCSAFLGVPIS